MVLPIVFCDAFNSSLGVLTKSRLLSVSREKKQKMLSTHQRVPYVATVINATTHGITVENRSFCSPNFLAYCWQHPGTLHRNISLKQFSKFSVLYWKISCQLSIIHNPNQSPVKFLSTGKTTIGVEESTVTLCDSSFPVSSFQAVGSRGSCPTNL